MKLAFFVDQSPVAQPRQRHALIGGHVKNYTPAKHPVTLFKQVVLYRASQAHAGRPMMMGALRVLLTFLIPRPQRLTWKTKPMPRVWAPGKPDADNLAKAVQDPLNGEIWHDDSQVVELIVQKFYAAGDESPGVDVVIEELE